MDGGELIASDAQAELAVAIEAAVRATPGVRTLYRSGSLISNLLRAGATALGVRQEDEPIVSVVASDDGVAVEASLGVDSAAESAVVLHAVQSTVDALLGEHGVRRDSITLTVVHVHSRETT